MEGIRTEASQSGAGVKPEANVDMRRSIVVPGKHCISELIIGLKQAEIKYEDIPVHMHHKHTSIKQLKAKGEKPTVMVHAVQIKETTTLPLPTEGDLRQATSDYCDLG